MSSRKEYCSWAWEYITPEGDEHVVCNTCHVKYSLFKDKRSPKEHLTTQHKDVCRSIISSGKDWQSQFDTIENHSMKCKICEETFILPMAMSTAMKNHLINKHNIDKLEAEKWYRWITDHFKILDWQKRKCKLCDKDFVQSNSFFLMQHLNQAHEINVPSDIRPPE